MKCNKCNTTCESFELVNGICLVCRVDSKKTSLFTKLFSSNTIKNDTSIHTRDSTEKNSYSSGKKISILLSLFGWLIFAVGIVFIFVGGIQQGFVGVVGGIIVTVSGLFLVAIGQVMLAAMDSADKINKIYSLLEFKVNK